MEKVYWVNDHIFINPAEAEKYQGFSRQGKSKRKLIEYEVVDTPYEEYYIILIDITNYNNNKCYLGSRLVLKENTAWNIVIRAEVEKCNNIDHNLNEPDTIQYTNDLKLCARDGIRIKLNMGKMKPKIKQFHNDQWLKVGTELLEYINELQNNDIPQEKLNEFLKNFMIL